MTVASNFSKSVESHFIARLFITVLKSERLIPDELEFTFYWEIRSS